MMYRVGMNENILYLRNTRILRQDILREKQICYLTNEIRKIPIFISRKRCVFNQTVHNFIQ